MAWHWEGGLDGLRDTYVGVCVREDMAQGLQDVCYWGE